ncbi:hypothetical protein K4K58_006987 [Colletotrichum sp. SAR11_239]|nr:hypothetical protein K4K58_006987 [Colletotrichum sp. SAR11_239]
MANSEGPKKTCPGQDAFQAVSNQIEPGPSISSSVQDTLTVSNDKSAKTGEQGDHTHKEMNQITRDCQHSSKDGESCDEVGEAPVVPEPSVPGSSSLKQDGTEIDDSTAPLAAAKKDQQSPKPFVDPDLFPHSLLDEPGQSLVTGMIDYLRVVDDRLRKIEDKLLSGDPKSDSIKEANPVPAEQTKAYPKDIKLEAKFFKASEDDFWPDGDVKDLADQPGRFSSALDQAQVLRVMYNILPGQFNVDSASPDPAHVEIIYVSILSDAIASFFREVLGLDCGFGHTTVRLSRPFRPLIRIFKPLKDQLAKLENDYGHLQTEDKKDESPNIESGSPNVRASGDEEVTVDGKSNDPTSSTTSPESTPSEQHEKPFERPSALRDFKLVVEFVDQYLSKSMEVYERITSGKDDRVAFDDLWMLYEPGTTIYCPYKPQSETIYACDNLTERTGGSGFSFQWAPTPSPSRYTPQAYHVLSTRGGIPLKKSLTPGATEEEDEEEDLWQNFGTLLEKFDVFRHGESGGHRKDGQLPVTRHGLGGAPARRKTKNTMSGLTIACFNIEYDGDQFGAQRDLFEINPYDGLKEIRSLQVYPMQYLDQQQRSRLLERGRKFVDLTKNAHMSYEGTTAGRARETINSEVIVDFKMAFERDNPQPEFSEIQPNLIEALKMQTEKTHADFKSYLDNSGLISLFPGVVPGYALRNRKWVMLDVDTLQDIQHGSDWKNLVLPKGHKEMVQAMVESYTRRSDTTQATHDIASFERADIDLVRGKVFLRILEYYPGILFLTTNRVGAIDDAFRSRLHLTLYYPKLLEKQSIKIWRNNITKLKEANDFRTKRGQEPIICEKDEILKWAKLNWESLRWNGRQIRNAFQTAIALAEFEAQPKSASKKKAADSSSTSPNRPKQPVLTQDTFLHIAKASTQFTDYLLDTHGKDEDSIAMRDQMRLPDFKAKTKLIRVEDSSESDTDSEDASNSSDSKSSSPDSDIDSNATVDSDESSSDDESAKKRRKAGKAKGKAEKKLKDKGISEAVEKADKKKDKKKKKKKSDP